MKVLKFGGTSVASAENIQKVISILKNQSESENLIVVVSAFGGVTDQLVEVTHLAYKADTSYLKVFDLIVKRHNDTSEQLFLNHDKIEKVNQILNTLENYLKGIYLLGENSKRITDKVVSFGEVLSSFIISEAVKKSIPDAKLKDSRDLIITHSKLNESIVDIPLTYSNIQDYFSGSKASVVVLPGFIASSKNGETTTLGRGGSDYTAALLAAAINASALEIWTDVSGMYSANPKWVSEARPIKEITYKEAMELSHFGAKVLYSPTIQPVMQQQIPTYIKNTFIPEDHGTLISNATKIKNNPVKGISFINNIALITLEGNGMVGVPGFAKRLFSALSGAEINVVFITQASSEHSICVGIYETDAEKAKQIVDESFSNEIAYKRINPLLVEDNLAIIAVVGDYMKSHQGISGKMFSVLGRNNINVRAIAQGASERNISAVIAQKDIKKALTTLHNRFFEKQVKTLHLFIVGVGNVGSILLEQIAQQQKYLLEHLHLDIKVAGISNSKKMYFDEDGIGLLKWKEKLIQSDDRTNELFFKKVKKLNLSNSIFVDITANQSVAETYHSYLAESISVVACNKIACSSDFKSYKNLKNLCRKYGASFLFETNVGAGLPIISTLQNLVNSGDEISSIQAVLSGSLNFVFNNYNSEKTFYEVVKQADAEGYTEPDPRIDLSGVDVARKILILARESGFKLNLEDILNDAFLPKDCIEANSVDDFYETLKNNEAHFKEIYSSAKQKGCQLKYVAEFTDGKGKVGLKEIPSEHPFYNLEGKDNMVLFYTSRYPEQPLIVKGAGAGAQVTASGLFADIISLGKQ